MIGTRRRVIASVALVAAFVAGSTACDRPSSLPRAKAGARCPKDGAFARNNTHVLQCKKNLRWTAILPIGQADALYENFVLHPPTTAAPATTAAPIPPEPDVPVTAPPAPIVTLPPTTLPIVTVPPATVPPVTVPPADPGSPVVVIGPPAPANGRVAVDGISADGRFALVTISEPPADTNPMLYMVDRSTGTTTPIAPASRGVLSTNGEFAAFSSDHRLTVSDIDDEATVYRWRRSTGELTPVSVGVGGAEPDHGSGPAGGVSDDGRFVVFTSDATNLVASDTNAATDLFRRDLTAGTTTRVNVTATGAQAEGSVYPISARLSASGRYVAFMTTATNLRADDTDGDYDVFRRDMTTGALEPVSLQHTDPQGMGAGLWGMSADGDRILLKEAFVTRVVTMSTGTRVDPTGAPPEYLGLPSVGAVAISPGARYVAYIGLYQDSLERRGTGLVVTDQVTHETRQVRAGTPCDAGPGRQVGFNGPTLYLTDSGRVFCAGSATATDPTATAGAYRTYLWPSPF